MNTISFLLADDLTAAFTIECASHLSPWTEKTFNSNQGERYLNLKISVDDQIAGFAITQIVLDEATLFNIAIAPDFQRQGLARRLLQRLIELLEEKDVVTLWLEVRGSNQAAIALYESLGFNEVSIRYNYYPAANGREDAVIMALML